MQRLLAVLLVLIGLSGLVLGRLGETTWAPATETTATVDLSDAGPAVVIDPGVLYVGGEEGDLVIEGASDVSVITAGNDDITAYLEDVHYTRITGASDWSTLSTEDVNPDGANELSDPTSSDLWRTVETAPSPYTLDVAEFRAGETGENEQPYRAILIVTDGTEPGATSVSLTWPNDAENEWVPFAYAGGATIAVIGLVLLVVSLGGRRRDERDAELEEPAAHTSAGVGATAAGTAGAAGAAAGTAGAAAVATDERDADGHDADGHDADERDAAELEASAAHEASERDAAALPDDEHPADEDSADQDLADPDADGQAEATGTGTGTAEDSRLDTDLLFGAADQGPREQNVWALPTADGTDDAADAAPTDQAASAEEDASLAEDGTGSEQDAPESGSDDAETPLEGVDRTEQIDAVDDEEGRR